MDLETCEPLLTLHCPTHGTNFHVEDVRADDNIFANQMQVSAGTFHRNGADIPVMVLRFIGESYIGEPHSSSDTIVDHTNDLVVIPLPLLNEATTAINEKGTALFRWADENDVELGGMIECDCDDED